MRMSAKPFLQLLDSQTPLNMTHNVVVHYASGEEERVFKLPVAFSTAARFAEMSTAELRKIPNPEIEAYSVIRVKDDPEEWRSMEV